MKRRILARMLGNLYKMVKAVEEPLEEAKRKALEPVEDAYREVLLSSLYRIRKPVQPSLDELKEQVKEALGVDLEEFAELYRGRERRHS